MSGRNAVRRQAEFAQLFFADAIAHASLTGIALGLLLHVQPLLAAMVFSVLIALAIAGISRKKSASMDTVIGVFYSTAMALGVIVIGALRGYRVDLFGYLFGDILGVSMQDVWLITILACVTLVVVAICYRSWIQIAFHQDLATVSGVRVTIQENIFLVFLALAVALGMKLVGVVLIGPLMIIPAATAKNLVGSMRALLPTAVLFGVGSAIAGLLLSYTWNTPSGPTIVLVAAVCYFLSSIGKPDTVRI